VRCSYLLTSPSRSFSAAGYTVLVFDYFLTLNDEVRLSSDVMTHTAEDISFITDLVHLECSLDMGEDHVPYQPLWKPPGTDFHPAGRGRHPRQ